MPCGYRGTRDYKRGQNMHGCENHHCGSYDSCSGRMYDNGGAGTWRAGYARVLRKGQAQGMHGPYRLAHQKGVPQLLLQLAAPFVLTSFLFGCTSAGNPLPEHRDEQLVCQSHESKICSGAGTASRIKDSSGSCYCAPVEQMQN